MALILPLRVLTLVPSDLGLFAQTSGIEFSQNPLLCQHRSHERASATLASGVSA
jgi:hypothetical protein